ncbi:MAG: hypothetical protein MRJ65_04185 [Candidatus Brocadiaceae bacterium]|nr:hypothetical protein [Candidatus Brocadiaceae bacterium]
MTLAMRTITVAAGVRYKSMVFAVIALCQHDATLCSTTILHGCQACLCAARRQGLELTGQD